MAQVKVKLAPKVGAAPGFPGFFAWLAATHPDLYQLSRVHLPNMVAQLDDTGSPGAHLAGYTGGGAVLRGIYGGGHNLAGLGADDPTAAADASSADSVLQAVPLDTSGLFTQFSNANFVGVTDDTPMPPASLSDTIANTIKALASTVLPAVNQQKILNVQLQRAQAGLAPLNTSSINALNDAAGLNFGLTGSTQKTFLLIAGLGAGALVLHSLMKRAR